MDGDGARWPWGTTSSTAPARPTICAAAAAHAERGHGVRLSCARSRALRRRGVRRPGHARSAWRRSRCAAVARSGHRAVLLRRPSAETTPATQAFAPRRTGDHRRQPGLPARGSAARRVLGRGFAWLDTGTPTRCSRPALSRRSRTGRDCGSPVWRRWPSAWATSTPRICSAWQHRWAAVSTARISSNWRATRDPSESGMAQPPRGFC